MMKKFLLAISAFALVFTACDPSEIEEGNIGASLTAEQLQSRVTLTQTTVGQNKFTFETNPATTVQVLDQDGNILTTGTSGSIIGTPPLTGLIVRAINQDGTLVSFKNDVIVNEYVDVPVIYKGLFGPEYSSLTWVWDTEASNGVWGNGAYMESAGPEWWQVQAADIDQQCTDKGYAQDGLEGWMTFTLAGKKVETSRGQSGTISWDLSAVAKEGWDQGTLTFNGTIPLLGLVKMGDTDDTFAPQYEYHILEADGEHLKLAAPKPGASDWGEAWFWNFKAKE